MKVVIKKRTIFSSMLLFLLFLLVLLVSGVPNLFTPANNTITNGTNSTVAFTFNYTGPINSGGNCTLYIDQAPRGVNNSNATTLNNSIMKLFANQSIADGAHNWSVNCSNETFASAQVSALFYFTLDNVPPNTTLIAPGASRNTTNRTINFNWTAIDSIASSFRCNLSIDSVVNVSNVIIINNTPVNQSVLFNADGTHTWNVSCVDNTSWVGNTNTSLTRTFTIDTTIPQIFASIRPSAGNEDTFINFNTTANDTAGINVSCTLFIGGVNNGSMDYNVSTNLTNKSVSFATPGTYSLLANCSDPAGNYNDTVAATTVTIADVTPPFFNQSVGNVTLEHGAALNYQINASDNVALSLYSLNDTTNFAISQSGLIQNNSVVLSVTNYSLNVSINDSQNNRNSTLITITVQDTVPPGIENVVPGTITQSSTVITFNTNETANATVRYGQGAALEGVFQNATFQTVMSFYLTGLNSSTLYYFNVTACDQLNHCNVSGGYNFTTGAPSVPTVSTSTSGHSSGVFASGAVGAASTTSGTTVTDTTVKLWDEIGATQESSFSITKETIPFSFVSFIVNKAIVSPSLRINKLSGRPTTTPDLGGKIYAYVEVVKTRILDGDIVSAKVEFRVPKGWFTNSGVAPESVVLYRFAGGSWNKLPTSVVSQDATEVKFTAASPGFSYFAIGAGASTSAPSTQPAAAPATTGSAPSAPAATAAKSSKTVVYIIAAIVLVAIITMMMRRRRY